jgi:hypothetical protein
MSDRWQPVPVPQGDPRHDIGDDMRAAIVERVEEAFAGDPDLTPEKARQLAMFAGACVRSLFYEMGVLRDLAGEGEEKPPRCAEHDIACYQEWICPECIEENVSAPRDDA